MKIQQCNCLCPTQLDSYKLTSAYIVVRRNRVSM